MLITGVSASLRFCSPKFRSMSVMAMLRQSGYQGCSGSSAMSREDLTTKLLARRLALFVSREYQCGY